MPGKGNAWGFLQIALKTDIELFGGGELFNQRMEQFKSIKTIGDARNYMTEVLVKIRKASLSSCT